MPPTSTTNRAVWVKAGGRCAICRETLYIEGILPGLNHFVGEVAHIVAEQVDGPRGLSTLNLQERNAEENLILLCQKHHTIVDKDITTYTVDALQKARKQHHIWVESCLSNIPVWDTKLFHLYYINIPRLSMLAAMRGASLDLSEFGEIKTLHGLGWELNRLMAGYKHLLQQVQLQAEPLDLALGIPDMKGMVISFNHEFRTKNIQMPEGDKCLSTVFTGDLKVDPHIYRRSNGVRIVMNIDPRWVTTTTAFCQFRPSGGRNTFAGLGFVNSVDRKSRIVSISPYVIGMPSSPFLEEFYVH
jgi:hypothetical protein